MTTDNVTDVEVKNERDPVLDYEVSLQMKVEDFNVLLSLLAKLPFETSAAAITIIRDAIAEQVVKIQEEKKKESESK